MHPLISIGIPVRNEAGRIARALSSISAQGTGDWRQKNLEIIISDNNSTDTTLKEINENLPAAAKVTILTSSKDLSPMQNFKKCFDCASGTYFAWLAGDDFWGEDYICKLIYAHEAYGSASLTHGTTWYFDLSETGQIQKYRIIEDGPNTLQHEWAKNIRYRKYSQPTFDHLYGVIRTSCLRGFKWQDSPAIIEEPLVVHLSLAGDFKAVHGAERYRYLSRIDGASHKNRVDTTRKKSRFRWLKGSWICTEAIKSLSGRPASFETQIRRIFAFALHYIPFRTRRTGSIIKWLLIDRCRSLKSGFSS